MIALPDLFARHPMSRPALVIACDVTALTIALPLAIMLRESSWLPPDRLPYLLACTPLLAAAALTACLLLGHYRAVWRYMGMGEIRQLATFALLAVLLFYTGQFLVDRLDHLPRSAPLIHFLVAMFLLVGARIAYGEVCRWREAGTGRPHRQPLLLVGSGSGTSLFVQMLATRHDTDYEPVGILCDDLPRHRSINGVPVLGRLDDIDRVVAALRVQGMTPARLVVTRPHHELGRQAVHDLMQRADAHRIPVEQLPDVMRLKAELGSCSATRDSRHETGGSPQELGSSRATPDSPHEMGYPGSSSAVRGSPQESPASLYPRLKRAFDIAVSATVLAATAPLLALASIAVAIGVQRPVLFVQIRPGLHRRPFRLLKFRTMTDPLDAQGRALTDAERTPLVGRLLRRTRLDELPQFWNVLEGDMAIIGPRPLIARDLDAMPDNGIARSRTRPGITGWAQVNGGHQLAPDDKLALDLWYTENASLALDARIVWRTILMMLMGERRHPEAIANARAALQPVTVRAAE